MDDETNTDQAQASLVAALLNNPRRLPRGTNWGADPVVLSQIGTGPGHQTNTIYPYTSNPTYSPYGMTSNTSTGNTSSASTPAATATTPGTDPSISSSFVKRAAWGTDPNIGNQTPTGAGHQIRTVF